MELSLGRRADYAIRAAVDLARPRAADFRKAREIGTTMAVPVSYLPQILALLVRAGIVSSVAGPNGGYRLARPAEDITLLDIIEATEGDPISTQCVLRGGPCRWDDRCAIHDTWSRAQQALLAHLDSTLLADIAATDEAMEDGTYEPPADVSAPSRGRAAVTEPA